MNIFKEKFGDLDFNNFIENFISIKNYLSNEIEINQKLTNENQVMKQEIQLLKASLLNSDIDLKIENSKLDKKYKNL